MIPEHIKKLITSDREEDVKIGFILAKEQGFEDDVELHLWVWYNRVESSIVKRYWDRDNRELRDSGKSPYKHFEILI